MQTINYRKYLVLNKYRTSLNKLKVTLTTLVCLGLTSLATNVSYKEHLPDSRVITQDVVNVSGNTVRKGDLACMVEVLFFRNPVRG